MRLRHALEASLFFLLNPFRVRTDARLYPRVLPWAELLNVFGVVSNGTNAAKFPFYRIRRRLLFTITRHSQKPLPQGLRCGRVPRVPAAAKAKRERVSGRRFKGMHHERQNEVTHGTNRRPDNKR